MLLQDPYDNKRYEIFMNEGQTERTAVRTEIAEDKPEPPPVALEKGRKSKRKTKKRSASSPKSGTSTEAIRQRFENDLQRMSDEQDDADSSRTKSGLKKLKPRMPDLDEEGQDELLRLKSEFEKMRQ